MFSIAEIMTRKPYTLGADDSLLDARRLMAEHHIRHIPVVSATGTLIGVVSQRDVLAAADSNLMRDQTGGDPRELYVALSSVMTAPVHTVDEAASLRGTALHLQKNRLGCLPVLRDQKLVGIITDSDFVSVAINLMEQLEMTEEEGSADSLDDLEDSTEEIIQ